MFSVCVEWSDLDLQWEFKQEIVRVPGDGVCFLKSVKHCLERELDVNYTIDQISEFLMKFVIILKCTQHFIRIANVS